MQDSKKQEPRKTAKAWSRFGQERSDMLEERCAARRHRVNDSFSGWRGPKGRTYGRRAWV